MGHTGKDELTCEPPKLFFLLESNNGDLSIYRSIYRSIYQVSRFVLISTFWYIISSLWIVTLMRLTARREAQASRKTDGAQAKTDVASISLGSDQAI